MEINDLFKKHNYIKEIFGDIPFELYMVSYNKETDTCEKKLVETAMFSVANNECELIVKGN